MTEHPRVSIVIPAFNASRFIGETIQSVKSQDFTTWELIVVDDASPDDTVAVSQAALGDDPRCRLVRLDTNVGGNGARNRGFQQASAEFALFLDADDTLLPGALTTLRNTLKRADHVGAHGVALLGADNLDSPEGEDSVWPQERLMVGARGRARVQASDEPTTLASLAVACWICTPGLALLRSSALNREAAAHPSWGGPWRPGEPYGQDRDLWVRLAQQGDFSFVAEPLLRYRQHAASITGQHGRDAVLRREQYIMEDVIARNEFERRLFASGWRAQALMRSRTQLRWAVRELKAGRPRAGITQAIHAASSYSRYRGLRSAPSWRGSPEALAPAML